MKQKKRVKSVYDMRSSSIRSQLGGSLQEDIEKKKGEIRDLESQLSAEKNAEKRKRIETALADAKDKMTQIQNRMKEMLKNVGSKLSSGISSISSKLSSGMSSISSNLSSISSNLSSNLSSKLSTLSKLFEKNKNERAIKDYYSMKAKVVMQIEMLKRQKPKKDDICKRVSEKTCNEIVGKNYPSPGDLFTNEQLGGIPRLFYY
jgi:chromosome segregation ATPase